MPALISDPLLKRHLNFKAYYTIYIPRLFYLSAQSLPPTVLVLMITSETLADNECFVLNPIYIKKDEVLSEKANFIFNIKIIYLCQFFKFAYFICMCACLHVCMHTICMQLKVNVRHRVGSGNRNLVISKSNQCFLLLNCWQRLLIHS